MCSAIVSQALAALHGGCVAEVTARHSFTSRWARVAPTDWVQLGDAAALGGVADAARRGPPAVSAMPQSTAFHHPIFERNTWQSYVEQHRSGIA